MKKIVAVFLLIFAGSVANAHADQTDPRLEELFAALKEAQGAVQAATVSQTIWQIWFTVEGETPQALMNEGRLAMATNRLNVALNLFTRLVEVAPEYAEGWNRRATVYFMLGDFVRSVADVAQVLALEPRHFGALGGLAQMSVVRGDPESALEALETAFEVYPLMPGVKDRIEELRIAVDGVPI